MRGFPPVSFFTEPAGIRLAQEGSRGDQPYHANMHGKWNQLWEAQIKT
jgi:hypothetical protein